MIAAGLLSREVTLLMPSVIIDGTRGGATSTVYRPVAIVPARIQSDRSDESIKNGETTALVSFTVTIRYVEDVAETWRIQTDRGQTLEISSVVEQGVGQMVDELVITAVEVRS